MWISIKCGKPLVYTNQDGIIISCGYEQRFCHVHVCLPWATNTLLHSMAPSDCYEKIKSRCCFCVLYLLLCHTLDDIHKKSVNAFNTTNVMQGCRSFLKVGGQGLSGAMVTHVLRHPCSRGRVWVPLPGKMRISVVCLKLFFAGQLLGGSWPSGPLLLGPCHVHLLEPSLYRMIV
jgi:hypothetical protein